MVRYYLNCLLRKDDKIFYEDFSEEDPEKFSFAFIEFENKIYITDIFYFNTAIEALIWMNSIIYKDLISYDPEWSCSPFNVLINSKEYVLLLPDVIVFNQEIDLEETIVKAINCFENDRELKQIKTDSIVSYIGGSEDQQLTLFNLFLNKFTGLQDLKSNDIKLYLVDNLNINVNINLAFIFGGVVKFLLDLLDINENKDLLEINLDNFVLSAKPENKDIEFTVILKELPSVKEAVYNEKNYMYHINGKKNVEIIIIEIKERDKVLFDIKDQFLNSVYSAQ